MNYESLMVAVAFGLGLFCVPAVWWAFVGKSRWQDRQYRKQRERDKARWRR